MGNTSKVVGKVTKGALGKGVAAVNPMDVLKEITKAYTEYKRVKETEKTKRREITSWERTNIERIRSQRQILLRYLDLSFDERRKNFERMFNVLDECVRKGDLQSLAATLESVVDLAKSSPFKELATGESVRALLEDPNRSIEF